MLMVCSATSRETPDIFAKLHANMLSLRQRKSTRSLSYLGFKPSLIWTVLAGSSASICTALASTTALKASDEGGIAGLGDDEVAWRLSSLNSVVATVAAASSMLSYSQFSTC
jgi:hypothetical protein